MPSPRTYIVWMGPLVGIAVAALLGWRSAEWLLAGAAVGYAGETLALRLAASERGPLDRAVAFFLVAQAALALIPFLALGGLLPRRPEAVLGGWGPAALLAVPVGAALMAGIRHAPLARRGAPAPQPPPARAAPVDARRWLAILGALALVTVLGRADAAMPAPFSLDFLYLIPVCLVTWATGRWGGLMTALFSAEVHGIARGLAYPGELPALPSALESLLIALGLAVVAGLLAWIQEGLEREKAAARTDLLTGLMNRKAFLERLGAEVSRADRYERPLSLAYLDLDGFKGVNDQHGHAAGDEVLRIVTGVLRTSVREQDALARLGGDEFAVLLVETDAEGAGRVMERLRGEVEERMRAFEWPVTCSVGVVTSSGSSVTVEELLRIADQLMYEVKHGGKNATRQAAVPAAG